MIFGYLFIGSLLYLIVMLILHVMDRYDYRIVKNINETSGNYWWNVEERLHFSWWWTDSHLNFDCDYEQPTYNSFEKCKKALDDYIKSKERDVIKTEICD